MLDVFVTKAIIIYSHHYHPDGKNEGNRLRSLKQTKSPFLRRMSTQLQLQVR